MRFLIFILSLLIFKQAVTVCPQAYGSIENSTVSSSSCHKSDHACCHSNTSNDQDQESDSTDCDHKCKCLTVIKAFISRTPDIAVFVHDNSSFFLEHKFAVRSIFSYDFHAAISNPPQQV
jgi:hypothetical protein